MYRRAISISLGYVALSRCGAEAVAAAARGRGGTINLQVGASRSSWSVDRVSRDVTDDSGRPVDDAEVSVTDGNGLEVTNGQGVTGDDGVLEGSVLAKLAGSGACRQRRPSPARVPVTKSLSIVVLADVQNPTRTPTIQAGLRRPRPPAPEQVRTIYMETDQLTISAALGGTVTVRAFAFDQFNAPLNGVSLIFDFSPKIGKLVRLRRRPERWATTSGSRRSRSRSTRAWHRPAQ